MGMEKDRKEEERELHDRLRGDLKDDKLYTSNKKFYSITRSNRAFVKNWLLEPEILSPPQKGLNHCEA